jgi:hypothetical protein
MMDSDFAVKFTLIKMLLAQDQATCRDSQFAVNVDANVSAAEPTKTPLLQHV